MMNGGCALGNTRRTAMFSMFTYMYMVKNRGGRNASHANHHKNHANFGHRFEDIYIITIYIYICRALCSTRFGGRIRE